MSIRILLVDDHQLFRSGVRMLLEQQPDFQVVGEATDGRQAIAQASEVQPDIVVMDLSMPEMNGVEATQQMRSNVPSAKIIALTALIDKASVVKMLRAGASAYLPKSCAFEELATAVSTVMAGSVYLSPTIAGHVLDDFLTHHHDQQESAVATLTTREREILQLLAEGRTSREIADRLFISPKTVDVHRQHLMDKLQLHSTADLVKLALREGLITL